jgi:hypothetical protein
MKWQALLKLKILDTNAKSWVKFWEKGFPAVEIPHVPHVWASIVYTIKINFWQLIIFIIYFSKARIPLDPPFDWRGSSLLINTLVFRELNANSTKEFDSWLTRVRAHTHYSQYHSLIENNVTP